jgi:hypothetical protein
MSQTEMKFFWSVLAAVGCAWLTMRVIAPPIGRALFRSALHEDPQLGEFNRSGRNWKGSIVLAPLGAFRLSLSGDRKAPERQAIELARELRERLPSLVPQIQSGLFDHYLPYKEAIEAGEQTDSPCPQIASAGSVWSHVKPAHVLIEPLKGHWRVEVAFETEWDIEHTVAAIFSEWHFIELNGSVMGI